MRFSAFWGLNWRQKSVFYIQENVAFIQLSIYRLHNTLLQAMSKWWKLNYVLLHVNKFYVKLWKIDWNIAFTWLKHNVKPVGLYESTSKLRFHSGFMIYFLFTALFKLVTSMSKVADAFRRRRCLFKPLPTIPPLLLSIPLPPSHTSLLRDLSEISRGEGGGWEF